MLLAYFYIQRRVTVTVTVAVRDTVPFEAVIVTMYVPGVVRSEVDTVNVAEFVPLRVRGRDVELKDAEGATGEIPAVRLAGVTCAARLTLPEKPLKLVNVNVDVPDDPIRIEREVGLEATLKSMTFTATLTDRVRLPLVPLILTV